MNNSTIEYCIVSSVLHAQLTLTCFPRIDIEERRVRSQANSEPSHSASVGVVRMKWSDVDVGLHRMEGPGVVGGHFCHVHQVETEHAIQVFSWNLAPAEGDEGGGEG